jgi:hypothetical protein
LRGFVVVVQVEALDVLVVVFSLAVGVCHP